MTDARPLLDVIEDMRLREPTSDLLKRLQRDVESTARAQGVSAIEIVFHVWMALSRVLYEDGGLPDNILSALIRAVCKSRGTAAPGTQTVH